MKIMSHYNFSKKRILQYCIIGFIAVILVFIMFIMSKIFYNSNILVVKTAAATTILTKERNMEKTGGSLELKSEDINGLTELYLKGKENFNGTEITGVYCDISNNKLSLYVPLRYKGLNLFFSCRGVLSYKNDTLIFTPDYFNVGKLSLPKALVMKKLKAFMKDLNSETGQLYISKDLLPFNISNLKLNSSSLVVEISKAAAQPDGTASNKAQIDDNKTLLIKAREQLLTVQSAAKSSSEKQIIAKMISVIDKIIDNPAYKYQSEANSVKAEYGKLSESDSSDLKDAIFNNMDMDTLKKLKSTFGL